MSSTSIALNRFGLGARPDDSPTGDPQRWLADQFAAYQPRPAALADAPTTAAAARDLIAYQAAARQVRQDNPMRGQQRQGPAGPRMADDAQVPPTVAGMVAQQAGGAMAAAAPAEVARRRSGVPVDQPMTEAERQRRQTRLAGRENYVNAVGARMAAALVTPTPFVERLVHFWANHFAISADGVRVQGFAGPFEFEAIRPHVLGSFRDLLFAVERHPAMLLYLDQAQSVGPGSPFAGNAAQRQQRTGMPGRKLGLNENLAREIMELHTLGVRTGYSQADVTEFARAMTGWTIGGLGRAARAQGGDAAPGEFHFAARLHEPGARTIMGKTYPQGGVDQASAVLEDLAVHPATARHIATKLCRHFIADDPPPAAVARVEAAFVASRGDLPAVYRALIAAPEAWAPQPVKFKTPWEWSVSTLRAIGLQQFGPQQTVGLLQQLGQPVWRPGSPAGWDDIAASWAGPDAVMRRVEAAERFANRAGQQIDARQRAAAVLPGAVTAATAQAIARAESPSQGLALMLVSPEFMRR